MPSQLKHDQLVAGPRKFTAAKRAASKPPAVQYQQFKTPLGQLTAVWSNLGLVACGFSETLSPIQGSLSQEDNALDVRSRQFELENAFDAYFASGIFLWNLERLDWSHVTPFRIRVLQRCYEIPSGQTVTYGELAEQVGHAGAARAVGTAMATNRWPILIPCHRVVGASGSLVGYSGAGGLTTKQHLIDLERRTCTAPQLTRWLQTASS